MDTDRATLLVTEAAAASSPASLHSRSATNDAALALAWLQGQAGNGRLTNAAALTQPLARLVAGEGLGAASPAVRANAAGALAAIAATLNDEDGAKTLSSLDAAAAAPLAQAVADAACPRIQGGAAPPPPPTSRALLINALAALAALCPLGGPARRRCLGQPGDGGGDDGLLLPALLAVALGAGEAPENDDDMDKGGGPRPDLEVREAALDVLCAAASAGPGGADGGPRRALVAAEAPAAAARALIVAGAAAEQEQEEAVVAAAAAIAVAAGEAAEAGKGQQRQQQQQQQQRRRAGPPPPPPPPPPQETPATELRMRCLLLLGILCGGGGGGGGEQEEEEAAARRGALRQVAREPGAIAALMASGRLGGADPQAAGVARALLGGLRRDGELAPLVEAAVREAVGAVAAGAGVARA